MKLAPQTLFTLALTSAFFACSKPAPAPTPPAATQSAAPVTAAPTPTAATATKAAAAVDPVAEAETIFTGRCVTCHGNTGHGDGPAAAALNPKPRSFSDADWQKSVTDEHIEKIILLGGAAVGKSPLMPPNPDLDGKAPVIAALRAKVRGYAK